MRNRFFAKSRSEMEISVFNIAVCDDMKEITAQLVQIAEQQSMKQIQTVKGFYSGGQLM